MKSWKIGAIAGLIAGIMPGIVYTIFMQIAVSMGLYDSQFPIPTVAQNAYGANILLSVIFGAICGIIYSRAYFVIPGKGISKSILYILILWLISWIRMATFAAAYGFYLNSVTYIFADFFRWITYGLLLGILYEYILSKYYPAKKELRIVTYSLWSGVIPGAIAGFLGGIAASIVNFVSFIIGLFGPQVMPGAPGKLIMDFWISQTGGHLELNLVWGAVFGVIFTQVYNLVPKEGIRKGLYYSLIIFLLGTFHTELYWLVWGYASLFVWGVPVGFFQAIVFGIVLGYFYKPKR